MSSVITNYNGNYQGNGLSVVIIDTGSSNYYTNDNVIYSYDFADNDNDVSSASHDHGGAVASVTQDVASGVNIIHLKVFSDNSDSAALSDIEAALQWVTQNSEQYNIAAVNMSLGAGNVSNDMGSNWQLADEYQTLDDLDIITTVAAGNSGQEYAQDGISYLAASDSVIAVSAVNANNEFAYFSQKHSDLTDISALGQDVFVDGNYLSGTSFSAPIIAGAAAIIQEIALDQLGHKISDEQFLDLIQTTADVIDPASYADSTSDTDNWFDFPLPFQTNTEIDYVTPEYDPGSNLYSAYNLAPNAQQVVINDSLNWSDSEDYYSFTLDHSAQVDFSLTGLAADVDLVLMNSYGTNISYQWTYGNADVHMSASLHAGETYFIAADSWDYQPTDYTLSIDFNGGIDSANPDTPDDNVPDTPDDQPDDELPNSPDVDYITPDNDPGGNINNAYQLNPIANQVVITDSLGYFDDKDFYSFTLDHSAQVSFSLTDLDGDVDMILKDANGYTLVHEWAWGNADLAFSTSLQAGQTYHIVTDSWDHLATGYSLAIDFNGGIDTDTPESPDDGNEEPTTPVPDDPEQPDTPPDSDTPVDGVISPDSDPGDSITTAYMLTPDSDDIVIVDSLGGSDEQDYYAFTVDNTAYVHFSLTELAGDVDMILKDANGHTLIHEWAWGSVDLDISATLYAGQTYHIVTDSWDGLNTDYQLAIDFNGALDIDSPEDDEPTPPDAETPAPETPAGYASINIDNAVNYFMDNLDDYAVV